MFFGGFFFLVETKFATENNPSLHALVRESIKNGFILNKIILFDYSIKQTTLITFQLLLARGQVSVKGITRQDKEKTIEN